MPNRPATHRPPGPAGGRRASPRATAHQRGYTGGWQRVSHAFLALHPLCHYCELLGRVTAAEHVDHYVPAEPNSPAFLDSSNWRPACAYHNSQKRDTPGPEYERRLLAQLGRGRAMGA